MTRDTTCDTNSLPLLAGHQTKTLDFGSDGVSASLSQYGRFLSIFAVHPVHGQVVVAPWPQFPERKMYDQPYVRMYRALPAKGHSDPHAGFGLALQIKDDLTSTSPPEWSFRDGSWPTTTASSGSSSTTSTFTVQGGCVLHTIDVHNDGDAALETLLTFGGGFSVHRASYTQLTPQGVCSIPRFANALVAGDGGLTIHNPVLPVTFRACLFVDGAACPMDTESAGTNAGPLPYLLYRLFNVEPGTRRRFQLVYSLSHSPVLSTAKPLPSAILSGVPQSSVRGVSFSRLASFLGGGARGDKLGYIVLRNVDYLLGCCAIPVTSADGTDNGTCIITDHQCLPLGWNRDNYWQLHLLSALERHLAALVAGPDDSAVRARIHATLRAHLQWVYSTAQRPKGYWARCFFVNGEPKDEVFQLDQQSYPLLELAEYAERFAQPGRSGWENELAFVRRLASRNVDAALEAVLEHRWEHPRDERRVDAGARLWLFKTDETPADDSVAYPYHFSSHVLLWRTLRALAGLKTALGDNTIATDVATLAERVHAATLEHFVSTNPATGTRMFAYLSSTRGAYQWYHDANDLPAVLAPVWGFCSADPDSEWANTMSFAFSPHNSEGYFPGGKFGGLGSVHTPDPWPLGDAQLLLLKALQGQDVGDVLGKLQRVVQWDGMFSEAVDRHTGVVTSKHWFSWPGCFISWVLVVYRDSLLL